MYWRVEKFTAQTNKIFTFPNSVYPYRVLSTYTPNIPKRYYRHNIFINLHLGVYLINTRLSIHTIKLWKSLVISPYE